MISLPIRGATPADLPRIRQLELQAPTAAHWGASQYDTLFSPASPARVALVAVSESADAPLVGFLIARCLPQEWEIENVVVDDQTRRNRIGSSLVRRLVQEALTAGASSIILEVRESNLPALRLYENIGFRSEGRRKSYYQDPVEDALLYRLSLQLCDKIP
jgi:[ribosomal protein S18]-alanine N-acetyltransferase